MTLSVGLTGGLASGKTVVAGMFASRGAYVMHADEVGRQLMQPGQAVYDDVVGIFGEGVVNSDRSINRDKLAEIAFGGGRLEELNRIVHPAVRARLEHWIDEMSKFDPRAILMFEAALILEAGLGKYFDKLIVVSSHPRQKLERFAGRVLDAHVRNDEERAKALREAERRIGAQLSDAEKVAAADYVIDNSGTLAETELQVTRIAKELQLLASAKQRASTS
ncbi:MAG TPA: dephospho-CoA kinase [Terriglobales bacterium]|jgi:dephospho-CoA kinase|nr:dephospho-CoA kinase [Terriglobales bacterium]